MSRPSRAGKKRRKAREWTLCVDDGSYERIYPYRIGEVWGDRMTRPHFKAPHEHVRVREVLPRARKGKG
jgi:hypothetical protein